MTDDRTDQERIAWLEGRVRALESALERRSVELRLLQTRLTRDQLAFLARLDAGLPDVPSLPYSLHPWREGVVPRPAEVEAALGDLWREVDPQATRAGIEPEE